MSKANAGDVVREGIEPDVNYLFLVEGNGNAPGLVCARDAKSRNSPRTMLTTSFRRNQARRTRGAPRITPAAGPGTWKGQRSSCPPPSTRFGIVDGAFAVYKVIVTVEGLAGEAVPTRVGALVDVAGIIALLQQESSRVLVALFGGADETVVRDIELLPKVSEELSHFIAIGLGVFALATRLALDVQAVLVKTRQKERIVPL